MRTADKIIQWFMPKEERFHELLAKDTANLLRAAHLFAELAHSVQLDERRAKATQLRAIEHEGDLATREIFQALNSTFITPFDREDIRAVAMGLDDILDFIEGVAQYLILFELSDAPAPLIRFADILVAMVEEIDRTTALIWNLANDKKIHESIVRISEFENEGDALYNSVIADLFKSEGSPVQILKWKEVYEGLEEACDACRDYTHSIANMMIKSA